MKKNENEGFLFVAGFVNKGEKKNKFIALKIRNSIIMNPVEPVLEQYPEMDVVIVGKDEKLVKKYLKKLMNK